MTPLGASAEVSKSRCCYSLSPREEAMKPLRLAGDFALGKAL